MALVAIGLALVYMTTLSTQPIVSFDKAPDNHLLKPQSYYEQQVTSVLGGSIFNGNKLTIDTAKIEADIKQRLPEINDVSVKIPLMGRRPLVVLDPAQPLFVLITQSGNAFVVDDVGKVISSHNNGEKGKGLIGLSDQSGLEVRLGQQILPGASVEFITTFIKELDLKGVKVSGLTLPRVANQLDVSINSAKYIIKVNLEGNARLQAGTYLALAHYLRLKQVVPRHYIDVRVEQRAYYK